ncbi:TetR/AcrR family transcriptional regulator [Nitrosospira sp. Is2]|uniref:TetR/AcrR family transcriptional regulator n=1 Tax=Nitrosospira sp. Is2 TaxID=3080532 RepID=UPI002954D241|nr:TetR/AcrR family transcriptional regulator [Nitrosospira sp. Is2]WON73693.1 TetR/AcrR family transcriptional regulator [Nitrosospira sp. Is2]
MKNSSVAASGRRERKRQQIADHLADTAWALFKMHGFDAVTMERVADVADVAKATLYKHFPVKEALLRHRIHRELVNELPMLLADLAKLPTVVQRLHEFFRHSAEWSVAHRDYLAPYLRFCLGEVGMRETPERESGLDSVFTNFISAGQLSGEFSSAQNAALLAYYLQYLHLAALLRWLHTPGLDLNTEFDRMLELFLHGLDIK